VAWGAGQGGHPVFGGALLGLGPDADQWGRGAVGIALGLFVAVRNAFPAGTIEGRADDHCFGHQHTER
jgi:hypothetical protein